MSDCLACSVKRRSRTGGWPAVAAVAAGTFLLVTTEFLPVGLLTSIASSMGVTNGRAGLLVTLPGAVAALAAPALTLAAARMDRRLVLCLLTLAIIASNAIVALSPNFATLLVARILLGFGVGGLWAFAIAVARRLVPEKMGARATAIISAGIGFGTVIGLPAGSAIGAWLGWRGAFACAGGFGVLVLVAQIVFLPPLPTATATRIEQFRALIRVPLARAGLIGIVLVAAGHFMAYTFLEPFLRAVPQLESSQLSAALLVYALSGIVGTFSAEPLTKWGVARAMIAASGLQAAAILLTALTGHSGAAAFVDIAIWGFAFGAVPVCVQIWVYNAAPDLYEGGAAMVVTFFQAGLALGAFIGGLLVDRAGIVAAFVVSSSVTFISLLIFAAAAQRTPQTPSPRSPA